MTTLNSVGRVLLGLILAMAASLTMDFPRFVDTSDPHDEACSKASGLTPPRWLCRRVRL